MDGEAQDALREMAKLNGVDNRVTVLGRCEVEGYEERLLDPAAVPSLQTLPILVELHDFLIPKLTELLSERFCRTHEITEIWQEDRSKIDFPWRTMGTLLLPGSYVDWAVSEWRPVRMAWLWMEPKAQ